MRRINMSSWPLASRPSARATCQMSSIRATRSCSVNCATMTRVKWNKSVALAAPSVATLNEPRDLIGTETEASARRLGSCKLTRSRRPTPSRCLCGSLGGLARPGATAAGTLTHVQRFRRPYSSSDERLQLSHRLAEAGQIGLPDVVPRRPGTDGSKTRRWRGLDSNLWSAVGGELYCAPYPLVSAE